MNNGLGRNWKYHAKLRSFFYRIEMDVWYDKSMKKCHRPKSPILTSEQVLSVWLPHQNRCSQFNCHIRTGALSTTATSEQVLSARLPHHNRWVTCSLTQCWFPSGFRTRWYKQALYNTDPHQYLVHMYLALTWFWIISPRSLPARRYLGDAPEVTYWSHFWANLDTLCFSGQIGLAVTAPDMNWIRVPETL